MTVRGLYLSLALFGYIFVTSLTSIFLGNTTEDATSIYVLFYRALIFICSLLFVFRLIFFEKHIPSKVAKYISLVLLVWCLFYLRLLWDITYGTPLLDSSVYSIYLTFGLGVVLLIMLSVINISKKDMISFIDFSRWILFFSIVFISISAFNSLYLGENSLTRFGLDKLNPISLGKAAGACAIISMFVLSYKKITKINYFCTLVALVVSVLILFLSGSRGALLSFIIVCCIALLKKFSLTRVVFGSGILVFVVFSVNAIMSMLWSDFSLVERISKTGGDEDQSANIRYQLYNNSLEQFYNSPLFGDYSVEREYMFYPHNVILELLMSIGVFGAIIFVFIVAYSVFCNIKNDFDNKSLLSVLWGLLTFYLVISMFSGSLFLSVELWVFLIISVSFRFNVNTCK
ncbi:O-antigen ligase family protein [Proteus terrae]|uniref:O-antigen ligase family protein n=1 Tax=Proteus terrae TaxID=1574161 RepID=UPI00207D5702|nr:O-antigen ligase family protein [Proteus terrae]MCO4182530.1 O-antigen ligase family protein [Proteus terrae]MCO4188270.1 O-antigen ligase family protein [Proteus terrae]